jgi:O-methyltransferase involved in polyketide biosynthesis
MSNPAYDKISPTAKLVADVRRFSDIPYAMPMAEHIETAHIFQQLLDGEKPAPELLQFFAPYAEARYKSLKQGILRAKVRQVVELASGFSFRGVAMAEDPDLLYVETDLPEMHELRTRLRRDMEKDGSLPRRANALFEPLDVTDDGQWESVEAHLRPGEPVAIVHEGLFQYFAMAEKEAVAKKIARLLKKQGGVWLTPDLEASRGMSPETPLHPQFAKFIAAIAKHTSRDLIGNTFRSHEEAVSFFTRLGFRVNVRPQIDGTFCLSSAARLNTTAEQHEELKKLQLWELALA